MNNRLDWIKSPVIKPNNKIKQAAELQQSQLTKPMGSLGQLESIAITLASLQGQLQPTIDHVQISVFAGDHGVTVQGVSAFPAEVTAEMVRNFAQGGAAICVLAREIGAKLELINLGTLDHSNMPDNVQNIKLGFGTANFVAEPAMSQYQLLRSLDVGISSVERAHQAGIQLFIGGEMGIGNTTSATAIASALLDLAPERLTGAGTGLDRQGIQHKCHIIQQALDYHQHQLNDPLDILRYLGGFEIAALVGAYLSCAKIGLPVVIDGFICTVAARMAESLCPTTSQWFLYAHQSAESGHGLILDSLNAQPLLDLGLRLGEASGAALVVPILRLACQLHRQMATFDQAQVSKKY